MTEQEYAYVHSTRNRFRLPTYEQYVVGSAGFGVFRELGSHIGTTV